MPPDDAKKDDDSRVTETDQAVVQIVAFLIGAMSIEDP